MPLRAPKAVVVLVARLVIVSMTATCAVCFARIDVEELLIDGLTHSRSDTLKSPSAFSEPTTSFF